MRNLQMSKNIVAQAVVTINDRYNYFSDRQKEIATKALVAAPIVLECLEGLENNRADALVKLVKMMGEFEEIVKPGTLGSSYMEIVKNDMELFFKENFHIDIH